MSDRNTGLFCPGHLPPSEVAAVFKQVHQGDLGDFSGAEAPRVGHGSRNGRLYTHIGLRLFEVGGLRLMDELTLPASNDIEMGLGRVLSERHGHVVYLFCDEERGAGGGAVFENGELRSRVCCDGRHLRPVIRDLTEERELGALDHHDWIWVPAGNAIEAAAEILFGAGIRNDDDICALIEGAAAQPIALVQEAGAAGGATRSSASREDAARRSSTRKRDRVRGWLTRFRER